MFTGIVEEVGEIRALVPLPSEQALQLTVRAPLLDDEQPLGASLAVDGVCLTVTAWRRGEVDAVVGPETLARTTLGKLGAGRARQPRAAAAARRPARRAHGRRPRRRRRAHRGAVAARRGDRRDRARAGARSCVTSSRRARSRSTASADRQRASTPRLHGVAHPAHADGDDAGAKGRRRPREPRSGFHRQVRREAGRRRTES